MSIVASVHVLWMSRSAMHLVYSVRSSFAMGSSPAFNVSMLTRFCPAISHFAFSSALLPLTSHAIIGSISSRSVCVVTAGCCHIILSRNIPCVPYSYRVLGSVCPVCQIMSSSGFCLGYVVFRFVSSSWMSKMFLVYHLNCVSRCLPSLSSF